MTDDREQQLDQIIADYLQAQEAGRAIVEADVIAAHPELADELREFFDDLGQVNKLASPLAAPVMSRRPVLGKLRYFGDYELLEEIARGGMGIVYKARQTSLNRIVAVKLILSGHLASETDVKRFQTEAESAANLQHPHIVSVHEVGRHNGQSYFSMDYIDGKNLSEIVREHPLPPKQAAGYVREVAVAIQYAHQQGTLHRDLKPSNVLIDQNDRVQITDFGLAMRVEGDSELTRTGQVLGTPSYMPPEQAQHKRGLIGPGSDIYSIGAVLYELLTGRPPFQADSAVETLRQVIETEPLSPRLLNPAVPKDLETICLKCLQKEPHKRYSTAQQLANDLGRFLQGEPILARPIGRAERAWRWCRRKPVVAGLSSMLALSLVAGIIVSSMFAIEAGRNAEHYQNEFQRAEALLGEKEGLIKDKENLLGQKGILLEEKTGLVERLTDSLNNEEQLAYFRGIALAEREWSLNNIERAEQILSDLPEPLRGWEYDYLTGISHLEQQIIDWEIDAGNTIAFSSDGRFFAAGGGAVDFGKRGSGTVRVWDFDTRKTRYLFQEGVGPVFRVVFSPDSRLLASSDKDGFVKVWNVETGEEVASFECGSWVTDLVFSKDGSELVAPDNHEVVVWNVADQTEDRRFSVSALSLALSPDGSQLACAANSTITLIDFASGEEIKTLKGMLGDAYSTAFAPDGTQIAAATTVGGVQLWNVETGLKVETLQGHSRSAFRLAFGPDERQLITVGGDYNEGSAIQGEVKIWDIVTGKELFQLRGHSSAVTDVAIHPNRELLATVTRRGKIRLWNTKHLREVYLLRASGGGGSGSQLKFSATGRYLSTPQGRHLKVWASSSREVVMSTDATDRRHAEYVAISPDESRVAFTDNPGTIRVFELATGKQLWTVPSAQPYSPSIAYSPDGRQILTNTRNTTTVWNAETGEKLDTFESGPVFSSNDGKHVAFFVGGNLHVWNETDKYEVVLDDGGVSAKARELAISVDGHWIATATDKISVWDAGTGHKVVTMTGHTGPVTGISFHPDGRRLATCSSDTTVKLWDIKSGQELLTFRPQIGEIYDVAFSPDGRYLTTRNISGSVVIWDSHRPPRVEIADSSPDVRPEQRQAQSDSE